MKIENSIGAGTMIKTSCEFMVGSSTEEESYFITTIELSKDTVFKIATYYRILNGYEIDPEVIKEKLQNFRASALDKCYVSYKDKEYINQAIDACSQVTNQYPTFKIAKKIHGLKYDYIIIMEYPNYSRRIDLVNIDRDIKEDASPFQVVSILKEINRFKRREDIKTAIETIEDDLENLEIGTHFQRLKKLRELTSLEQKLFFLSQ